MKQLFESWNRFLKEDKGPSRDEQLQAFLEDDPSVMENWSMAIEADDGNYQHMSNLLKIGLSHQPLIRKKRKQLNRCASLLVEDANL